MPEDMEVEEESPAAPVVVEDEDEEDVEDLLDLLDQAKVASLADDKKIALYEQVLQSDKNGPKAIPLKERSVYDLVRVYCSSSATNTTETIVSFLKSSPFLNNVVTKAKCAKIVRQVLEIVASLAPQDYDLQQEVCEQIVAWCVAEKRNFLRQRVQAKLSSAVSYTHLTLPTKA